MLTNIEEVVSKSNLVLRGADHPWTYFEDHPHIRRFSYSIVEVPDDDDDEVRTLGTVDGYRIIHDWTVESDDELRDEADALDGDILMYVESLIRELGACEAAFDSGLALAMVQHVTVLRHVQPAEGVDETGLVHQAAAFLAMLDAPGLMLVDAWPYAERRGTARGKLQGRSHVPKLLELGFVRMVGSRFLWAWNRELADGSLYEYSYEGLLEAKRAGKLADVLGPEGGPEPDGLLEE